MGEVDLETGNPDTKSSGMHNKAMSVTKSGHDYSGLAEREQFHQGNARTIACKQRGIHERLSGRTTETDEYYFTIFAEGITTSRVPGRRRTKYAPGDVRETIAARGAA